MDFNAELNRILDPKIFQVVGSTPASLKQSIEECGMSDKPDLGVRFVALSVFAASVNKKTAEGMYMESDMGQLRTTTSRKFTINNTMNMTALSLAGHCFLAVDTFSQVKYVSELRKKMGQNSIWDGQLTGGSLSEKQKTILQEKSKVHTKADAQAFANWFIVYTGIGKKRETAGSDVSTVDAIPSDLLDYARNTSLLSNEQLAKMIASKGLDKVIAALKRGRDNMGGSGEGSTL